MIGMDVKNLIALRFTMISVVVIIGALFLVACGTLPVPVKQKEPTLTRIPTSGADTSNKGGDSDAVSRRAVSSGIPRKSKRATPTVPPTAKPFTAPRRTPNEHITEAIKYLQNGKAKRAQQELEGAIRQQPSNMTAINLLVQINTPPKKFFSVKKSFTYTVKSGESLSMIARKFLNKPLQFYILAKYNGMDNPSKLRVGQKIRIPGKRKSTAKHKKKRKKIRSTGSTGDDELKLKMALARKLYRSGKYQETIDLLEGTKDTGKYASKRRDLLVLTYAQYANVLTQKAELLEAETVLEKAVKMAPDNTKLKKQLTSIRNRRDAGNLYNAGLQALNDGDQDKAYEAFSKVLELNPKHALARRKVTEIKSEVIESLHKSAMNSYQKHELNKAIEMWDKVLEMDPEHELAKLYRARAIDLRKRFDKL